MSVAFTFCHDDCLPLPAACVANGRYMLHAHIACERLFAQADLKHCLYVYIEPCLSQYDVLSRHGKSPDYTSHAIYGQRHFWPAPQSQD
jgi:hypothetical protein